MEKKKIVAISKDEKKVFVVKNVDEQAYKKLLNNEHENDNKLEQEKLELKNNVLCNQEKIRKLERRDLLLAKSIYDNFVDRGLIENDDAFQQAWYDYFINDAELKFELYPAEFSKILDKVRGW